MIFYFSGTGNTKWVARQLAEVTGEELLYIPDELRKMKQTATKPEHTATDQVLHYTLKDGERLGFCFPTHGWQPPRIVREFIRRSTFNVQVSTYTYAVTTCGDNMGYAMRILNKQLRSKGLQAQSQFAVLMPESNVCFSFLHLDSKEREREKIAAAHVKVQHICEVVKARQQGVVELIRGAIPFTYTYVIGGFYNKHLIRDDKFWVDDDACIRCGLCQQLCPVDDIILDVQTANSTPAGNNTLTGNNAPAQQKLPPRWKHDGSCTNCLACYHHCPRHAIHWAKMKRGQYLFKDE